MSLLGHNEMHISLLSLVNQGSRKTYKRTSSLLCCSPVQSAAPAEDYHNLHLVFAIMLYKSLVSYIAAFTMASSVAVSANQVARDGGCSNQCNTGVQSCCSQMTNGNDPKVVALASKLGIDVSPTAVVGLDCVFGVTQW